MCSTCYEKKSSGSKPFHQKANKIGLHEPEKKRENRNREMSLKRSKKLTNFKCRLFNQSLTPNTRYANNRFVKTSFLNCEKNRRRRR